MVEEIIRVIFQILYHWIIFRSTSQTIDFQRYTIHFIKRFVFDLLLLKHLCIVFLKKKRCLN